MVSYQPEKTRGLPDPDEIADRLANQLKENNQLNEDEDLLDRVRTSETPLAEPIGYPFSSHGSAKSAVRYTVLTALKTQDEIVDVSFDKMRDDREVSITTHSSTLKKSNRLLHPASLAKIYQYGYWPSSWSVIQGETVPDSVDSVAGHTGELRQMNLVWKDEYFQKDFESDDRWFADSDAVTEFAARVTDDDIPWAQYITWYRTTAVSTYRLRQAAETTDWSEFPEQPDSRPNIKGRFDTATNPRVGDFIRMAVLQRIEKSIPTITNLSTGPDPWATNRVSLVVDPTAGEGRPNGAILCPYVALKKLAEYGYRPTDGWYDAPAIGYEPDDPMEPRRIEFTRGSALRTWCENKQIQSSMFDDATKIRETGYLPEVDWQALIPCVRSQIISYRQLHNLTQNPEALF